MIESIGKGNIKARIIADSINSLDVRITTFELEYPRFIHSELMTHRQFSRNAASSRAIPVKKMLENIEKNPAMPIHWGANQKGMQANKEHDARVFLHENSNDAVTKEEAWYEAMHEATDYAKWFSDAGYHKQIVNRITETYQMIKVIVTATEWDNWYELRNHEDAQPEIRELARCMLECHNISSPQFLKSGDWHLPYVRNNPKVDYLIEENIEDAIKVSISCCAQVSYRVLDDSVDKAKNIFKRLVESKPMHASPLEHVAKVPMLAFENEITSKNIEHGITHKDIYNNLWSGNFRYWIQYRQVY